MSSDAAAPDWNRIHTLFADALDRPPEARQAFLDECCAGDPALRAEIEALLAAHDSAGSFLSDPAIKDPGGAPLRDTLEGERVGPWRVLRLLGRGGMGAVYLAERSDGEYERQVALKVVKRGLDTDAVLARFLRERQILARLEHPAIARFLDAGATADGRPYFVMERIEGTSLIRYCDMHGLGLEERLRLFGEVCRAVQFAHRNLVVHRDLKPSNILVTPDGQVKLLDFGIAKVLGGDDEADVTTLTVAGLRPVTPEYASPEQLRGEPVTTAADVYSLGAVLYELVAGRTPFRLERRSPEEALKAIATSEPLPPSEAAQLPVSAAVSAAAAPDGASGFGRRGERADRQRLTRMLRGDMDTIILTALRADATRRYPTADALLDELRRYLAGRPIAARPDTVVYRLSKFIGRHRLGVGIAAVMAVMLSGSVAAVLIQQAETAMERDRAQLEATKANQIAAFLTAIFESADPDAGGGDHITARQLLDAGAERLEGELADQPELRAELAGLLASMYYRIGDDERAIALHEQALELRRELFGGRSAEAVEALVRLADPHVRSGDLETADSLLGLALELAESLPPDAGADLPYVLEGLASVRHLQFQLDVADSLFRHVLELRRTRGDSAVALAAALANLSRVSRSRSDYDAAERYAREALGLSLSLHGEENRLTARHMATLAFTLHAAGKLEEAEDVFRRAVDIQDRLYAGVHPELATLLNQFGRLLHTRGSHAEAERVYERSIAARSNLAGADDARIATTLTNLGGLYHEMGQVERALAMHEDALAMRRRILEPDHPDVATALNNRAVILIEMRRYAEAAADLREVVSMYRSRLGPRHRWVPFALVNLASVTRSMGDLTAADSLYREAQAIRDEILPSDHPDRASPLIGRGEVLLEMDRPAEAEPLLREALRVRESALDSSHWRVAQARSVLGEALSRLRRREEAERLLTAGLDGLAAAFDEESSHVRQARRRLDEHRRRD